MLVAETPSPENGRDHDARREAARLLASALGPECEIAPLHVARHAAIVPAATPAEARTAGDRLERALAAAGREASVGWACYPADGAGGLALVGAAVERLQTRRLVRGEWQPTAESAGLIELLPGP